KEIKEIIGAGSADSDLSTKDLEEIVASALLQVGRGTRVLAVVPDKTRDDNTDVLFSFASGYLKTKGVERFDGLVAQGTHGPMTAEEKHKKLGLSKNDEVASFGQIFDHDWNRASELVEIGELSSERVAEITNNIYTKAIPLRINRLLAPRN